MPITESQYKARLMCVASLAVLSALFLVYLHHAAASTTVDGDLDPSFGSGGKVTTHFSQGSSSASAVVVQADNNVLVAGSVDGDFLVTRYLPSGSLDPSFGSGGSVTTDFTNWDDTAKALVVQPDARIVVAGSTEDSGYTTSSIALARYLPGGQLDSSFGTAGRVTTNLGTSIYLSANGMALQTDGKIVVAGRELSGDCIRFCVSNFIIARYNFDGTLDTSLGGDGIVITDFPLSADYSSASSVVVQPDGKIVAAGVADPQTVGILGDFALARYLPDGTLDPSFGVSGTVTTDFEQGYDRAQDLVLQPDGKIVAAGSADYRYCPTPGTCYERWHFAIARYLSYGQLDATFGVSGTTTVDFGGYDTANSISLQSDGKLILAGLQSTLPNATEGFALARLLPTGAEDLSFGNSGKVVTTFGDLAAINGVTLQRDNKIVAVGVGQGTSGTVDVALARYLNDVSLPPPCPGERFTDVCPGDYFYTATLALAEDGILLGYSTAPPCNNSLWIPCFKPYNNVTRGQASKIVSLAANFNDPVTGQTFEDVPPGATFYTYTERMAEREIIVGYPCGTIPTEPCVPPENRPYFRTNNKITRGQMSKIIALSFGWTTPPGGQQFQDVPPGSTFYDYIAQLYDRNIINGYPCGSIPTEPCIPPDNLPYFRPSVNVTRGQTAKIVDLARTQPTCSSEWHIISSPNPPNTNSNLNDIAVVADNDIWAVGSSTTPSATLTLIEHWDGVSWSIVPSPNPSATNDTLNAVVAVAANDVWAVGGYIDYNVPSRILIEHWDGTNWSVVPGADPGPHDSGLYGVTALATDNVWAVGWGGASGQLVEHWDGSTWNVVPSPNPNPEWSLLSDVAVVSANDVWAVGWYGQTLIEHWDGSTWNVVPSPNPNPEWNSLSDVAVVSANDVWATGSRNDQPLVEHWDGNVWSVVPSPNGSTGASALAGVAVVGADDVWAAGSSCCPNRTLVERYNPCIAATSTPTVTPTSTLVPTIEPTTTATTPATTTATGTPKP